MHDIMCSYVESPTCSYYFSYQEPNLSDFRNENKIMPEYLLDNIEVEKVKFKKPYDEQDFI